MAHDVLTTLNMHPPTNGPPHQTTGERSVHERPGRKRKRSQDMSIVQKVPTAVTRINEDDNAYGLDLHIKDRPRAHSRASPHHAFQQDRGWGYWRRRRRQCSSLRAVALIWVAVLGLVVSSSSGYQSQAPSLPYEYYLYQNQDDVEHTRGNLPLMDGHHHFSALVDDSNPPNRPNPQPTMMIPWGQPSRISISQKQTLFLQEPLHNTNPPVSVLMRDEESLAIARRQRQLQTTTDDLDCSLTIQRPQCNTALAIADLNRNDQMDDSEYVRFVNRLSSSAYLDSTFSQLPGNIQAVFIKFATNDLIDLSGSKPGQTPTEQQDVFINALCCETDLAVADPGSPVAAPTLAPGETGGGDSTDCTEATLTQTQCNTALAIADMSRDDFMDETEYVRFINRLSNDEYSGADFSTLPSGLQSNFQKFATTNGQVDVTGSKPGESPTTDQAEFLAALCCETELAVADPGSVVVGPPAPQAPSPPSATPGPTFQPQVCRTALASSDFNRDDSLNQEEYVRFLNRLTLNQFQSLGFSSLSEALQANFDDNAQSSEVNIVGTKPGQTPSAAQAEFLDDFCVGTASILSAESAAPVAAPVSTPTQEPELDWTLCRTAMASSDASRDDYLSEDEFVVFLNRFSQNDIDGDTFDALDPLLQQAYADLVDESTGEIWIFGSKPGEDASDAQEAFLTEICVQVSNALEGGGTPSPAASPSSKAPTTQGPTLPPGIVEVFNSFIISNTRSSTAADLEDGPNREGLDNAYGIFVERAVEELAKTRRMLQRLRKRNLVISTVDASDDVYLILDGDCPKGLDSSETCQTVFAKFQVKIDDEDPDVISKEYSDATQQKISDGVLQEVLIEVDPRNTLRIVNSSLPVIAPVVPTPAPVATPAPNKPPKGGGGGKGNSGVSTAGAVVGGIVGSIALCAFIGWASTKFKGNKVNGLDDDDEKADDASDGEKEDGIGGLGAGADDDNPFGKNTTDNKKTFGFGKKNKEKDQDNKGFGGDTNAADNAFGDDNSNNMDMFAFDEPSVVRGPEDPDGVSAGDSNRFGAGDPGWGNTNGSSGFFGNEGGWGAPSTNKSESDNFFGASTFNEHGKSTGSRSHSGSESRSGSRSASDDDSDQSSEDDSYESESRSGTPSASGSRSFGTNDDDESYSRSSADDQSGSAPGSRDGVGATSRDRSSRKTASSRQAGNSVSEGSVSDRDGSYSGSGSRSGSGSESRSGSPGISASTATTRTEELEKRAEYYAQVDALVRLVLPAEVEKVDAMMEQFKGREAELVSTLQTMQERSATQRARAAVHKSKSRPQRGDEASFSLNSGAGGGGAEGSAAGTAAIAAASLPIPAEGMFEDESIDFDDGGPDRGLSTFHEEDERSGSYSGSGSRSGSYSGSGSRTFDEGEGEGSYRSGEEGSSYHSGSYRSGEGSYSQSGSGSYYSGSERSGSQSHYSGSQQNGSHHSGSYRSGSGSGSYSRGSRSGSGSGSYDGSRKSANQQDGSFRSGSFSGTGSQQGSSYRSGSQTLSHRSGSQRSGSQRSGSERSGSERSGSERSGLQRSGNQRSESQRSGQRTGSQRSGQRSGSQRSEGRGDDSGSQQFEDEESYYSEEEISYHSGEERGSYHSGEEEGSYYSGEEEVGESFSGEEVSVHDK